jgi:hypothetical protein
MNRRSLGVVALLLIILMVIVATAGLDNLPRADKQAITAAATHLNSDRAALDQTVNYINTQIRNEPDLFQAKADAWHDQLTKTRSQLDAAATELADLERLAKANRRSDRDKVERELKDFDSERQAALNQANAIRSEAGRWLTYKRELPQRIDAMRATYNAIKSFDIDDATSTAQKALVDWPVKKDDLQNRIDAIKKLKAQAQQTWDASAKLIADAESKKIAGAEYGQLFDAADKLDSINRDLKERSAAVNTLAAQLYTSWDKVLVDLDKDNGYRERIRTVTTRYPDATLSNGKVSSQEAWQPVDESQFKQARRLVGMETEHKPAGKYDFESQKEARPGEYTYIAPPGQSNQYGSWSGGVWHWLPQYLILRELLRAGQGPPITINDYDAYNRARRDGSIFYGRNNEYRIPWGTRDNGPTFGRSSPSSGQTGGWYRERPKPSFGDQGFGGSKYQSRGGFAGSRYQSRGGYGGFSRGGSMRSFGRGGRR